MKNNNICLCLVMAVFVWISGCATNTNSKPTYAPVITKENPNRTSKIVKKSSNSMYAIKGLGQSSGKQNGSYGLTMPPPLGMEDYNNSSLRQASRYQDIWMRIRSGFRMPPLNGRLTEDKIDWYISQPDYLERMFIRSGRYMHYILHEVEKRGIPTEIALLPFVESAFNPLAFSSAAAAGMWQFIPSTGKNYNLSQNFFEDKRLDVVQSTNAALDYLTNLYDMFGDWALALAAYNAGENRVSKEIRRNEAAGLPTDYESLRLPKETRHYVPKLMAIKSIVNQPELYGISLPAIADQPYFEAVPITKDIDIQMAARLAQLDLEEFRNLNPAHKRPVITAATNSYILLPVTNAQLFKRNIQKINVPLSTWTTYTTYTDESIAAIAQRVGTSPYELAQANNLSFSTSIIQAGRTLLVPNRQVTQNISSQEIEYSDYGFAGDASGFSLRDYAY